MIHLSENSRQFMFPSELAAINSRVPDTHTALDSMHRMFCQGQPVPDEMWSRVRDAVKASNLAEIQSVVGQRQRERAGA